ncbi:hypothetical protein RB195_010608 [Necator americanus]|uniref:Uncharacterized protein n=1 Tax=Necator americanus TaxID=51031 RepID=A0ABR1D0I7_NECAM
MDRLDCTERKLFRRLLGYFWLRVCQNEELYAEIHGVCRLVTRGRYQHLAPPSKVATENCLRFFGHTLRRPRDRLVQRILRSLSDSSRKWLPGRKRKFWTEVVKEDLRTLDVDRQFRRNLRFRRVGNIPGSIPCKLSSKIDEGWAELCSRRHTSAKMRVIASGDDISPLVKSSQVSYHSYLLSMVCLHITANCKYGLTL